jgi:cyclohexyl-isocyanide hydratase
LHFANPIVSLNRSQLTIRDGLPSGSGQKSVSFVWAIHLKPRRCAMTDSATKTELPKTHNIVFPLFDNVTQLDFSGPVQFLSRLPGAKIHVAAESLAPIATDSGFSIVPNICFSDCPPADILCVPGGVGVAAALSDRTLIDFVRDQAIDAQWVTSVCTGAFILGAAGLLAGKHATTHWGYTHLLEKYGATYQHARVVRDGNLVTAGGVTSGIDFALELIAMISGEDVAKTVQLSLEYNPAPPFVGGTPETSPPEIVAGIRARFYDAASLRMEAAIDASA